MMVCAGLKFQCFTLGAATHTSWAQFWRELTLNGRQALPDRGRIPAFSHIT